MRGELLQQSFAMISMTWMFAGVSAHLLLTDAENAVVA